MFFFFKKKSQHIFIFLSCCNIFGNGMTPNTHAWMTSPASCFKVFLVLFFEVVVFFLRPWSACLLSLRDLCSSEKEIPLMATAHTLRLSKYFQTVWKSLTLCSLHRLTANPHSISWRQCVLLIQLQRCALMLALEMVSIWNLLSAIGGTTNP